MPRVSRFAPFWITLPVSTLLFLWSYFVLDVQPPKPYRPPATERQNAAAYVGGTWEEAPAEKDPDLAVRAGLGWLTRHQFTDGMWSARSYFQMCPKTLCLDKGSECHDVAITSLAVLAILESGYVHEIEGLRPSAERALRWLVEQQDAEGCFGPREGPFLYGHSIATYAFCRAFSILNDPMSKVHARRGVRFLEAARHPDRAWRYGYQDPESDTSVTLWAGAALTAALAIDVEVRSDAIDAVLRWLDDMTGPDGVVSYNRRGGGSSAIRGRNDRYEPNECLTAFAAVVRSRAGVTPSPEVLRRLGWNLPVWNAKQTSVDFYYWFTGTLALTTIPGDPETREIWTTRVRELLCRHQRGDGCSAGSWDAVDKWGCEGGRVYATAINVLTLIHAR